MHANGVAIAGLNQLCRRRSLIAPTVANAAL
jgi:hypothetical protein